jgi:hypothetical protein
MTMVYAADPAGPILDVVGATDLIGEAFGVDADWVTIPVSRLGEDFFTLRTRVAGEIAQKFANYRINLAIIGDISTYVAASDALRDFVHETNRGRALWFVPTEADFQARLSV